MIDPTEEARRKAVLMRAYAAEAKAEVVTKDPRVIPLSIEAIAYIRNRRRRIAALRYARWMRSRRRRSGERAPRHIGRV